MRLVRNLSNNVEKRIKFEGREGDDHAAVKMSTFCNVRLTCESQCIVSLNFQSSVSIMYIHDVYDGL